MKRIITGNKILYFCENMKEFETISTIYCTQTKVCLQENGEKMLVEPHDIKAVILVEGELKTLGKQDVCS